MYTSNKSEVETAVEEKSKYWIEEWMWSYFPSFFFFFRAGQVLSQY